MQKEANSLLFYVLYFNLFLRHVFYKTTLDQ